ncbi:MAG: hypothetical protein BWZ02_00145 [Lentisphaerae bacterium ADurb.BinA184]|nr:MAG: hypothetical protein BWZ02_00145 [Lentisphaerae bacterium ADurb.BinA184]
MVKKTPKPACPPLMPIEGIPDWERRLARQDAFWQCAVLDRPVVTMSLPKERPDFPWPAAKPWASLRERWWDTGHIAESAKAWASSRTWLGDSLPTACPNLGPEVFSAFFGTELEYGESTSWSVPNLLDWKDADRLQFSTDNPYWKKIIEITDALLEAGRGRFYTGVTDLHPGGDALTAFRDPLNLNLDLIEHPDEVKRLVARVTRVNAQVMDFYFGKLRVAGQAITCWAGIVSTKNWYVPSNDFSCMVSKAMFDEFFLPGIAEECRGLDASIYHLDGPGALRHLDSLLEIPELNAIQWVYGAGHGRATDWLDVYRRCQAAGKGIQLFVGLDELDTIIGNLRPEGVWLGVGVENAAQADEVLRRVGRWHRP